MGIKKIVTEVAGLVGVLPKFIYIETDSTLAQVTTTGFLNVPAQQGYQFSEYQMALVSTKTSPSSPNVDLVMLQVEKSGGNISLVSASGPGSVTLPTIANHIATYTNVSGALSEDPATAISGGNIQAGLSGTAGYFASFPGTASRGSLRLAAVANTGDTLVTISNAAHAQASVYSIPDVGAATGQFNVVTGALTNGNLMQASGTAGKLADSGVATSAVQLKANIKAAQSADIGGAGAGPIDIVVAGATASSVAVATVLSSSNAVEVLKVVPGANKISVTFNADPGASAVINYVVFIAAQ